MRLARFDTEMELPPNLDPAKCLPLTAVRWSRTMAAKNLARRLERRGLKLCSRCLRVKPRKAFPRTGGPVRNCWECCDTVCEIENDKARAYQKMPVRKIYFQRRWQNKKLELPRHAADAR